MADNTIQRLKSQLLKSGLQNKDQPLFQVINQLIDAVNNNSADITSISGGSSGSGGGGGTTIINNNFGLAFSSFDDQDRLDSEIGFPGPQGLQGIQGPIGPPGIDAECECCDNMPFMGNSIHDGTTLKGEFKQVI